MSQDIRKAIVELKRDEVTGLVNARIEKGEGPLQLPLNDPPGEEPPRGSEGRFPLDMVLHDASSVIGGDKPMRMHPFLERTRDLSVLEQPSLLKVRMLDHPRQLGGALFHGQFHTSPILDPPLPFQDSNLRPGGRQPLQGTRAEVPRKRA